MKKPYAIIHVNWDGMETFKVVPFERIDSHGKRLIYEGVWTLPSDNARSRTLSTVELIAVAENMGRRISFHSVEEVASWAGPFRHVEVQDEREAI